jgi:hypothetical protein
MGLVSILESGRRDFLEATREIPLEQASIRPAPNSWSALECVEHVIVVEDRYLEWIANGAEIHPRRNSDRELRLFTMIRNRLTKVACPPVFLPAGRFRAVDEALGEFNAARDRSVRLAEEHGDGLYSIGANHPFFGEVNGVELMQLIDGHARRHADQIREIIEGASTGR